MRVRRQVTDADRELHQCINLILGDDAGLNRRVVLLMIQVELAHDHDLEAVRYVGDSVATVGAQPINLLINLFALNIVHFADLIKCVLLDALVTLRILLRREQLELVREVAHVVDADAELLIIDFTMSHEHRLVA